MQKKLNIKIMKKCHFFIQILIVYFFICSNLFAAKSNFFIEGKALYENQKFEKSKILFERDIVFNPKSENSYLYLAKIYNNNDNKEEEENNLESVLLLNPENEEALYMLTLLKIDQSDYDKAKDLIYKFNLLCKSFCSKKSEIKSKFDKLIPKNDKDKN